MLTPTTMPASGVPRERVKPLARVAQSGLS
jgi:hypothetical protein